PADCAVHSGTLTGVPRGADRPRAAPEPGARPAVPEPVKRAPRPRAPRAKARGCEVRVSRVGPRTVINEVIDGGGAVASGAQPRRDHPGRCGWCAVGLGEQASGRMRRCARGFEAGLAYDPGPSE